VAAENMFTICNEDSPQKKAVECSNQIVKCTKSWDCSEMEKVHFWPSNSCQSLVLAIKLQSRLSSAIQLSRPFKFGHLTVSIGGFNCFYLQFSPYNLKRLLFFSRTYDFGDSCGHTSITVSLIFLKVLYTILSLFFILFLCYCVKTTI
jgi:hypothetical protein